jgi:hypothetical protein
LNTKYNGKFEWSVAVFNILNYGCAVIQVVSHWSLTMEGQVQSKASPDGICGGQSDIGRGFSMSTAVFAYVIIILTMPHTHI